MDEPSSSTNFQPGDLLWAKMKGFPPWPAKVLEMTVETPARRIPVMFFGTLETSFMKPADLSDYMSYRKEYEIARKQKDFNKAVREIRRAAGLSSEQDESAFPVNSKSPPSSPRASSVMMNTAGESKRKRSNSASTKSRSRASSTASVYRTMKDLFKKDRRRLDSESSHGSKRKMISGMGVGQGSEVYEQYADSTDFNALFGDSFINDLGTIPDDNKSWKSKRSRGSSKIFDDLLLYGTHRTRNRSGSASGRRSRLISMSGFSGVSDVFDDFFNNHVDLDVQAEQLMHTLNNMPSDGSIDRPLSPELAPTMPAPVEFCLSCGFECRLYNGVLRCNHCSKYKETTQSTSSTVRNEDESRNKLNIPLSLNIKTESVSSGEKFISNMLMARPPEKSTPEKGLKSVKQEVSSPAKQKKSNLVINIKHEDSDDSYRKEQKKKRKVQLMSPRSPNMISIPSEPANNIISTGDTLLSGRTSRDRSRPKHYKVEKTPPISASGHRHCVNCNGQVRPQMCGGNRHRWRCVDKKCRKWYGWVRSHEEIPKNVGRKKVGVKQPQIAVKPQKVKKKEEPEEENPLLKRKVGRPSKNDIKIRLKLQKEQAAAALVARSAIQPQISSSDPNGLQRRKYTKRKNKDGSIMGTNGGSGNIKKEFSPFDEDVKKRSCSPLNEKEASYRPCAMEKRARWWTGEKRRVDVSPERELGTTAADTAAAFRMMAHAVRSAAVTRADEVGTVNGSLDLLMDTLVGSMAPLLSLLQNVPAFQIDPELSQQLWNSSAIHIPTFQ